MKWKGRRQSKNVEDRSNNPDIIKPGELSVPNYNKIPGNEHLPADSYGRVKYDPVTMDNETTKAARQMKNIASRRGIPTPTPKPNQATPGDWVEKKADFRGRKNK